MDPKRLLKTNAYNLYSKYEQVYFYNFSFEIYTSRKELRKYLSIF